VLLGVDGRSNFNGLHSHSTITRCSSTPSIFWRRAARIFAGCRYRCARPTWRGSSLAASTASSCPTLNTARSVRICPECVPDGLEGLVSKHRESTYRAGRFDRWIKVKHRERPASPVCGISFRSARNVPIASRANAFGYVISIDRAIICLMMIRKGDELYCPNGDMFLTKQLESDFESLPQTTFVLRLGHVPGCGSFLTFFGVRTRRSPDLSISIRLTHNRPSARPIKVDPRSETHRQAGKDPLHRAAGSGEF
jgi:hypothetical protein